MPGRGFAAWCGDNLDSTNAFVVDLASAPPVVASTPVTLPIRLHQHRQPRHRWLEPGGQPAAEPIAFDQVARGANVDDVVYFYDRHSATSPTGR
ncbi:MAG: hypothetical protein IPG92_12555 [Flavobacteriales bacterium]|nr:hypothetical protein [Flavobacteriales bacterium]